MPSRRVALVSGEIERAESAVLRHVELVPRLQQVETVVASLPHAREAHVHREDQKGLHARDEAEVLHGGVGKFWIVFFSGRRCRV